MAHGLVHNDRSGDGDVEGRYLAGHGDSEEMVAGLLDQIVEPGALSSEDEDAVGFEVEVGVVGGTSFVQPEDPYVLLLELFEGANEVGDSGDANVLGCAGGGFGNGRGDTRSPFAMPRAAPSEASIRSDSRRRNGEAYPPVCTPEL